MICTENDICAVNWSFADIIFSLSLDYVWEFIHSALTTSVHIKLSVVLQLTTLNTLHTQAISQDHSSAFGSPHPPHCCPTTSSTTSLPTVPRPHTGFRERSVHCRSHQSGLIVSALPDCLASSLSQRRCPASARRREHAKPVCPVMVMTACLCRANTHARHPAPADRHQQGPGALTNLQQ